MKITPLAAMLAVVLVACSSSDPSDRSASVRGSDTGRKATFVPPTAPAPPSTTTTAVAPGQPLAVPAKGIGKGSKNLEVYALEQRLAALKYDTGPVDGVYDDTTAEAVTAFQKVHGMPRTGRLTQDVANVLGLPDNVLAPQPLMPTGPPDRVEVDVARQVLFLYKGGNLDRIVAVSTGRGNGWYTPSGQYTVFRRVKGWDHGRLGALYNPLYFNQGIAFHGYPSVPAYPASHGCVRIPMSTAEWFPSAVANGTTVYVIGGSSPSTTSNATTTTTAPKRQTTTTAKPPAKAPSTTSTTAKPTTKPTTTTTVKK